jgi:hypothetical protein
VFSLANNYMKFQDDMKMRNAASDLKNGMLSSGTSGTGGPYGPDSANASNTPAQGRPDYDTFDDDPELSKLPKLAKKTATALKGFSSSDLEGKGAYGRGQSGTPDSPHDGMDATGAPAEGAPAAPQQAAIGSVSPTNAVSGAYGAGKAVGASALDWLGQLGAKIRELGQNYDHKAPTPAYLPPEKPPNVGPAGAGGGAGPGTLDTLQQHSAVMGLGGGAGYPGGPSLAMQQQPVGARILSAMNPTAGPVA